MSADLTLLSPGRFSTLEEKLQALCAFGAPTLFRMANSPDRTGWWCKVNMHVASKGTAFEIGSDAYCPSPSAAVDQCAERIAATLNNLLALK